MTRDIESLNSDNDLPTDIWSDGVTLWVLENSATGADAVFAYDLETGERLADQEFELDSRNRFSHGIWSDGETVWIADSGQDQLFAYSLASGERLEGRDFELADRNRDPRGIWSDRKAIYVLDSVKDALFVYNLETGELIAEYPLDKLNASPRGIWSDGVTIWVSDDGAKRLFAYEFEDTALTRNEELEFTFRSLLKAGNGDARGIWSDGDVLFVVDEQDAKVYTYNMPDAIDARLAALSISGMALERFAPARTEYVWRPEAGQTTATVAAEPAHDGASLSILPEDADGDPENGHQLSRLDVQEITVTVTSVDGSRSVVYRVRISQCLSGLSETRLSMVRFGGGSVDDLLVCARSLGVEALYHDGNGIWAAYFLDGPDFINQHFRNRFSEGLQDGQTLIAGRYPTQIGASGTPGGN